MRLIYLDYAATHPMTAEAIAAYSDAAALPGNPASVHIAGQAAREKLEEGRQLAATALGVDARTLVLNSGATEGNNQVILGAAQGWQDKHGEPGHLVTTQTEHSAVLAPARLLEARGWEVTFLAPDKQGRYSPQQLREALRPQTALVSIHHVNNEIGTVQPTPQLAAVAREAGCLYHTDAVQAPGVVPLDLAALGAHFVTLSAHKWGGPRGVGLLHIERGQTLPPLLIGGGQEGGQRAGTQNTAGAYAAGVALAQAVAAQPETARHLTQIRAALAQRLCEIPGAQLNQPTDASPKVLSVTFDGLDGEALLMNLDMHGVAASAGSACSAGTMQPSHVLLAIGLTEAQARATLRLSFGAATTPEEIEAAAQAIAEAVRWSGL